jgi:hypothetical protein
MTKNEILKKIGIIIIELREQYDLTQLNRDDINDIELELFAANSHFLTDHIEILRKLNNQEVKPLRQETPSEPKYFEPVVKPTLPEKKEPDFDFPEYNNTVEDEPEDQIQEPIKEEYVPQTIIRHELILDEPANTTDDEAEAEEEWVEEHEAEIEQEEEQPEPVIEPIEQPIAEVPAEPEIIIAEPQVIQTQIVIEDTEDKPLVTINQILSAQLSGSPRVGDHAQLQPIKDLKSAITLNDKLLFVRDLFNGYSMAYGEAVEILNRFSRFEEADQFLKINYYTKNNWEAKQATTDKFYELLQRRFPE